MSGDHRTIRSRVRPHFSDAYWLAVEEAQRHHLTSKTYSGRFLRPHAPWIAEIIDRLKIDSILDYGAGKGEQYRWISHDDATGVPQGMTLEEFWGIDVVKFDPAWPPFSEAPGGNFDLVICTHVLGSIPRADFELVRNEIYDYALRAVYIAEKIGPVEKQVFSAPGEMPRNMRRRDWLRALRPEPDDLEVWLTTRELDEQGNAQLIRGRISTA